LIECGTGKELKGQYKINANAMRDSLELCLSLSLEANKLTQPPDGKTPFEIPDDQENVIMDDLNRSIKIGKEIDVEFLKWLHPDLAEEFHDNFITGMKLYVDGLEEDDVMKQIRGNNLTIKWAKYWEKNKDTILKKMYPNN